MYTLMFLTPQFEELHQTSNLANSSTISGRYRVRSYIVHSNGQAESALA